MCFDYVHYITLLIYNTLHYTTLIGRKQVIKGNKNKQTKKQKQKRVGLAQAYPQHQLKSH